MILQLVEECMRFIAIGWRYNVAHGLNVSTRSKSLFEECGGPRGRSRCPPDL